MYWEAPLFLKNQEYPKNTDQKSSSILFFKLLLKNECTWQVDDQICWLGCNQNIGLFFIDSFVIKA